MAERRPSGPSAGERASNSSERRSHAVVERAMRAESRRHAIAEPRGREEPALRRLRRPHHPPACAANENESRERVQKLRRGRATRARAAGRRSGAMHACGAGQQRRMAFRRRRWRRREGMRREEAREVRAEVEEVVTAEDVVTVEMP